MSYGVFSEVYLAVNCKDSTFIKIGETTNARRRNGQLATEGYFIKLALDIEGGETERLFIESFLRARIEASGKAHRYGKDYFQCDSKETADYFYNAFLPMVKEACSILKEISTGNPIEIKKNYNKPIIPVGEEKLYNEIINSCKRRGEWFYKWQCGYEDAYETLIRIKKVLEPCGYDCQLGQNYSWKTLRVKKPFTYD